MKMKMERSKKLKIKNVTHTKEQHIFESIFFTLINIFLRNDFCCNLSTGV